MIIIYTGRRGAGKTLSMMKDALRYQSLGWKVYRNIEDCKIGEFMSNEQITRLDKKSHVKNCVIMIDEAQILFESTNFLNKNNKSFSHFVQQIRKRNIILLITTQFSMRVDIRIREQADVEAKPRFLKKYPVCKITYIDNTSLEDFEEIITKTYVYNPKPIFGLYNTKEMIA